MFNQCNMITICSCVIYFIQLWSYTMIHQTMTQQLRPECFAWWKVPKTVEADALDSRSPWRANPWISGYVVSNKITSLYTQDSRCFMLIQQGKPRIPPISPTILVEDCGRLESPFSSWASDSLKPLSLCTTRGLGLDKLGSPSWNLA